MDNVVVFVEALHERRKARIRQRGDEVDTGALECADDLIRILRSGHGDYAFAE
jgi:hypothetical protein